MIVDGWLQATIIEFKPQKMAEVNSLTGEKNHLTQLLNRT